MHRQKVYRSNVLDKLRGWRKGCGGVEDVVSVLTLVLRGAAQVCHVLRVEELREQLEVEEEEAGKEDGQEEE